MQPAEYEGNIWHNGKTRETSAIVEPTTQAFAAESEYLALIAISGISGVRAFCTYCSASKSPAPGELPAIKRYLSERIHKVYEAASILDFPFFILSGQFGLLAPEDAIPYYDHLLGIEEVKALSNLIKGQMLNRNVDGFIYFTKPLAHNLNLRPYHDALEAACVEVARPLCIMEWKESGMSTWKDIMRLAEVAKAEMVKDRATGKRAFDSLLKQYPNDGMVFFKRGEAYKELGAKEYAAEDFRRAMGLFPMPVWKEKAREAYESVKS